MCISVLTVVNDAVQYLHDLELNVLCCEAAIRIAVETVIMELCTTASCISLL